MGKPFTIDAKMSSVVFYVNSRKGTEQFTSAVLNPCVQHPGCSRSARYGPRDEPPIACQSHKKCGQFTINRDGELLVATRHGDGKPTEMLRFCDVFQSNNCAVECCVDHLIHVWGSKERACSLPLFLWRVCLVRLILTYALRVVDA